MNLVDGVRRGDPRSVSRAISEVENGTPEGRVILDALAPSVGRAVRIGITGPPGVGKSTLIDAFVRIVRSRKQRVGVIAVDPTSPFSGGALLGDRIRMAKAVEDPGVFMRSMASRGGIGGLSRATQDVADVLDASGADAVLIETVGVGQSEVEIARATDCSVVVLSPESGDGIQAMKSGLMEIADLVVINKADREGADRIEHDLRSAFALRPDPSRRDVPVLLTEATQGKGVAELAAAIDAFIEERRKDGGFAQRREENMRARLRDLAEHLLRRSLWDRDGAAASLESLARDVLNHARTSYQAAELLVRESLRPR